MRHRVRAAVEVRRPQVAPEPDVRAARLRGGQHQPAHPLVGVIQVRPYRDRLQARPENRRREDGFQVTRADAEDVQRRGSPWSAVTTVTSQPAITWSNSQPPAHCTASPVLGAIAVSRGRSECLTGG